MLSFLKLAYANRTIYTLRIKDLMLYVPIDSAPPGHFCLTDCPLSVVGQVIFQSTSVSRKHIVVSVYVKSLTNFYNNHFWNSFQLYEENSYVL